MTRMIRDQAALGAFTAGAEWVDVKVRTPGRRRVLFITMRASEALTVIARSLPFGSQAWVRALPQNIDDWTDVERRRRTTWLTLEALDAKLAEEDAAGSEPTP
jgi:hypothetical protein